MPQDIDVRVGDRHDHPPRHLPGWHPQLAVYARHHHVQFRQQFRFLVQRAVVQDVDLDAGQDAERRQFGVQSAHHLQLAAQPFRAQPARHLQPRRVVRKHHVLVSQPDRRLGHLPDGAAPIRPVGVHVAVAAQQRSQRPSRFRRPCRRRIRLEFGEVGRHRACGRLRDHPRGHLANALQLLERARRHSAVNFSRLQFAQHLRRAPERPHPVGRLIRPFEQKRDSVEGRDRVHRASIPDRALNEPPPVRHNAAT